MPGLPELGEGVSGKGCAEWVLPGSCRCGPWLFFASSSASGSACWAGACGAMERLQSSRLLLEEVAEERQRVTTLPACRRPASLPGWSQGWSLRGLPGDLTSPLTPWGRLQTPPPSPPAPEVARRKPDGRRKPVSVQAALGCGLTCQADWLRRQPSCSPGPFAFRLACVVPPRRAGGGGS